VSADVLGPRALNRATLARQMLLRRVDATPFAAVEHLVGMQAQVPLNPYLGLWSRLDRFQPEELGRLLLDRRVVRIPVMRATIHLVTDEDALTLRALTQRVLDAEIARHPEFSPALVDVDLDEVLGFAAVILATPRTNPQLRAALAERFPDLDAAALAYACRCKLPLVQVPPRGVWGRTAQVTSATTESWLGRPLAASPSIDDLLMRYLGAFGPATTADMTTWSRLTGLREVVDRLRPRLCRFRDEAGRELVDLPDAPRPDPETPAPPRFLPEYDNVLLSHADRSRFAFAVDATRLFDTGAPVHGSVLVDGVLRARWRMDRDRDNGAATLMVTHVGALAKRTASAVAAEGRRLVRFLAVDAPSHDVRVVPLD